MQDEVDLQRYVENLMRRKRMVLVVFLLVLLVGIVLGSISPPIYEATILLFPATFVDQSQLFPPPSPLGSAKARVVTNPYRYPSTLAEVAQSDAFIHETMGRLGIDASSLRITTRWYPDSLDVRLTVRAYTPGTALRVCEALAAALVQMSAESTRPLRLTLEQQFEQARGDVSRFRAVAAEARMFSSTLAQRRNLTAEEARTKAVALEAMTAADRNYLAALDRERVLSEEIAEVVGVRMIGSRAIEVQVAPKKRLNIVMATTLGLLGGLVAAIVTESLTSPRRCIAPGGSEARR